MSKTINFKDLISMIWNGEFDICFEVVDVKNLKSALESLAYDLSDETELLTAIVDDWVEHLIHIELNVMSAVEAESLIDEQGYTLFEAVCEYYQIHGYAPDYTAEVATTILEQQYKQEVKRIIASLNEQGYTRIYFEDVH